MAKLMKKIFFALLILIMVSCSSKKDIDEILINNYGVVIVPDSLDGKAVELNSNHLKEILVLMFNGIEEEDIKEHFKLSDARYGEVINKLFNCGLIRKNEEGKFIPACMIIDEENEKQIINDAQSLSKNFAEIMIDRYGKIKEDYSKINSFKNIPFEKMSSFILYNVMLDEFQFKNIEEKFIKAEPPKRGNKRYYLVLQEQEWIENDSPYVGYSTNDEKIFYEMTGLITDDLLNQLEYNRPLLVKSFLNSVYKNQISFREWFVWVYQFIAREAKDILVKRGYIKQ